MGGAGVGGGGAGEGERAQRIVEVVATSCLWFFHFVQCSNVDSDSL